MAGGYFKDSEGHLWEEMDTTGRIRHEWGRDHRSLLNDWPGSEKSHRGSWVLTRVKGKYVPFSPEDRQLPPELHYMQNKPCGLAEPSRFRIGLPITLFFYPIDLRLKKSCTGTDFSFSFQHNLTLQILCE